ncbi:HalOD1 output domain-containing protein [Natronococcus sp.]|uniref:HalOD1 output domain-containing protein n=1 Tax=Natronococcus sp. TaxID=35747 RepID=UPI0025D2BB14|nr:HalOD1 output domain-containing protein [Natronococcus sp.]
MTSRNFTPGDAGSAPMNTVVFRHDWTSQESLVGRVVAAVADVTDSDETDVERVHDRLDPESLNRLFDRRRTDRDPGSARLIFPLETCTITVYGSGLVVVQE